MSAKKPRATVTEMQTIQKLRTKNRVLTLQTVDSEGKIHSTTVKVTPKYVAGHKNLFNNANAIRYVNPRQYFLRTGIKVPGVDPRAATAMGEKILSKAWHSGAREREAISSKEKVLLPPTRRGRINGMKLTVAERREIDNQLTFAVNFFATGMTIKRKSALMQILRRNIASTTISIKSMLLERGKVAPEEIRKLGVELYGRLLEKGEPWYGLMREDTGKMYFPRGWTEIKSLRCVPIHEAIHGLQKEGIIEIDVPFAQAVEIFYALDNGISKINPRIKDPAPEEFDRKPRADTNFRGVEKRVQETYYEADWSYGVGKKIAQWAYKKLGSDAGWAYLYRRCNGATHAEAIKEIKI